MNKKFIVRLSDEERATCQDVIKKLKGSSEKVRRAQILLKVDADGPGWTDRRIAEAFHCRVRTIENLRKRRVTEGFEAALERKKRQEPSVPPKRDGAGEARLIAMRLGKPPAGYGHWTLQLLADCVCVTLVCDNLNTHSKGAFYEAFEPEVARAYLKRIHFCYTPKHGSWLNVAECEWSCLTSQCLP